MSQMQNRTLEHLHQEKNAALHMKAIVKMILRFSPIIAKVIQEGVQQGVFYTKYPLETTQYILCSNQMLFDPGIFFWNEEELQKKMMAVDDIVHKLLGAETGVLSFSFSYDEQYRRNS